MATEAKTELNVGVTDVAVAVVTSPLGLFQDAKKNDDGTVKTYNSRDLAAVGLTGLVAGAVIENAFSPVEKIKGVIGL